MVLWKRAPHTPHGIISHCFEIIFICEHKRVFQSQSKVRSRQDGTKLGQAGHGGWLALWELFGGYPRLPMAFCLTHHAGFLELWLPCCRLTPLSCKAYFIELLAMAAEGTSHSTLRVGAHGAHRVEHVAVGNGQT